MPSYPAIVRKHPSSDFGVEFPDLPGCISAGETLEEAAVMAAEALALHLEGLEADDAPVPAPSSRAAIEARLDEIGRDDLYTLIDVAPQS